MRMVRIFPLSAPIPKESLCCGLLVYEYMNGHMEIVWEPCCALRGHGPRGLYCDFHADSEGMTRIAAALEAKEEK